MQDFSLLGASIFVFGGQAGDGSKDGAKFEIVDLQAIIQVEFERDWARERTVWAIPFLALVEDLGELVGRRLAGSGRGRRFGLDDVWTTVAQLRLVLTQVETCSPVEAMIRSTRESPATRRERL